MHGYGPCILAALPKVAPGITSSELRACLATSAHRTPSLATIQGHLRELRRLECIQQEGRRYWRLVDSVYDLPGFSLASEVSA